MGQASFRRAEASGTAGRIAVVTDSVSQLTPEMARQWGITVVPVRLILGEQQLRDGIDITPAELYRRMREEGALPRTSGMSVGEYLQVFLDLLQGGAQAIICLTLSSRLSMGFSSASHAAELARTEFPGRRIEVIDTRTATRAEGFIALEAARLAAEGRPLEEIVARAHAMRSRVGLVAAVATLEYLARSGRVAPLVSMVGNLLQVKPVVTIQEDGTATLVARVRTNGAALEYMIKHVAARAEGCQHLQLAVLQADSPQEAAQLRRLAAERWPSAEIEMSDFTPVMGAHTGPGLIGLAYHCE